MDDRKKQINELEQRKREQIVSLDALLVCLGEVLLNRAGNSFPDNDSAFTELAVFRRLNNDIADSESAIQSVEEQIRRFRELEESIEAKEQENSAHAKELAVLYGRLGKLLLDASANGAARDGDYVDFCRSYREHADALLTKVLSLEERLPELEDRDGGNVFTWIGKNAKGMVLRSFLTKAQDNLEQLYRNVGERYSRRETINNGTSVAAAAIGELCADIERRRGESHALVQELTDIKEERRAISGSFNAEGGPLKQIQTLKNHISHIRDELKTLFRRIGAEASALDGAERKPVIDSLILPEDQDTIQSAAQMSRLIRDNETAIEKIRASLAIDDEEAKIEKYRRTIQEKRNKIAQTEKDIMELEESIRIAEASIEKLQSLR